MDKIDINRLIVMQNNNHPNFVESAEIALKQLGPDPSCVKSLILALLGSHFCALSRYDTAKYYLELSKLVAEEQVRIDGSDMEAQKLLEQAEADLMVVARVRDDSPFPLGRQKFPLVHMGV